MNCLGLLLFLLLQAAKPLPVPGMPAEPGVYYLQKEAQWTRIESAPMADMKTKGVGLFLETDGLSGLDITVAYEGANAQVQIPASQPTFYVRGAGAAKDAMIIALTRKKDSRTLKTSSLVATVDNKGGFKKDEIRSVTVVVFSDDSFSVTPEEELKPGEYLLVFGYPSVAFDFGIKGAKK